MKIETKELVLRFLKLKALASLSIVIFGTAILFSKESGGMDHFGVIVLLIGNVLWGLSLRRRK